MKPLVIIPARGGSKGVPRKNIKHLGGKPLIQYTIEAARGVFPDKLICVSTDDLEIKKIVETLGLKVPFLRPAELSTDEAGTYEVLLHAIGFYEKTGYYPDTLILLQATSPFRTWKHISEALKLYNNSCEMIVSVKETKSNPYSVLHEENNEGWLEKSKNGNYTRRQDVPKVWELNGAIYIINVSSIKENPFNKLTRVKKYVMNEIISHDIDTDFDWLIAETIVKNNLI
ncbi:MAG: acylneuraminate cytidylyltransferase family protein [Bacteroidetes bacterium HGW-Bacteroidetes-8]|jgi:N-acylneuraminate cytidylyltransferase|nr:MAG: acylneuraminate cytidylyltransferase family protein [Bacteroidetes bacterium HGW-Bacteroidetes-8]